MNTFEHSVALITGGASGIGFGMAQAFAARGMRVALADVDERALAIADATLRDAGARTLALQFDVRDAAAWDDAIARTEASLGPLQVLCSNAGVAGSHLPIEATAPAGWQWTLDVNLQGTFNALRAALPRMRAHGREAHIVCTSSLGAFLVHAGNGAYCASKAAVIAVCEAVRQEVAGSNIGISVLCPGLVATNLLDNVPRLGPSAVPLGAHAGETAVALRAGMDPRQVGEHVVRAIAERRFWIFTHPELRPLVEQRCQEILAAMSLSDP